MTRKQGASPAPPRPQFFVTAYSFRAWLVKNHATKLELLVGFYKRTSGKPGIAYGEALDQALCFGWIDGVRKGVGPESYFIRFTPRKAKSYWSAVNIAKARALISEGLMKTSGLRAFEARDAKQAARYSFENAPRTLDATFEKAFRANRRAWAFFEGQPPSYRRVAAFWVMSAKKKETREARLALLVACSARGDKPPPFVVSRSTRRA